MDENSIRWRIKMYCKLRGVSLNQLEGDCGLGKGYVSKLDKSSPNIKKLEKIADYLGVDLNSLVYGKQENDDKLNSSGIESTNGTKWYFSDDTARLAQEIHDNPRFHALCDAERHLSPESMEKLAAFIDTQLRQERGDEYAE